MIDIHNHILPNVDDGAKTIEESVSMLETAIKQGISDVVSTIHFQHPKMENKKINQKYLIDKKNEVQNAVGNKIKIHLGAEVYFLPNLLKIKKNELSTFNHGKYMLIEFQSFYNHPCYELELIKLKMSGTTPIIAHPERSVIFRNNINILIKLIELGCLIQVNAGSFLGTFGKKCKSFAKKILLKDMVHIIASDSHNTDKRNFCLGPAYEFAHKLIGEKANVLVKENPGKVISGENIEPFKIKADNFFIESIKRLVKK